MRRLSTLLESTEPMPEYPYVIVLEGEEPWIIMAPDDEQAAWNALSLSESLSCPLVDVYREENFSKQLAGGL